MSPRLSKADFYAQFNREYYSSEAYADYLQEHAEIAQEQILKSLFATIPAEKGWTFLDVGCGMGGTVLALRDREYLCHGTEISPFCLQNSAAKEWMEFGETFQLPFPDQSFDVVLCCDVFEYLTREETMQSIDEFARVARRFVSVWVFSPDGPSWSQEENPDALRIQNAPLRYEEYVERFAKNGAKLRAFTFYEPKEYDIPEWHFVFSVEGKDRLSNRTSSLSE